MVQFFLLCMHGRFQQQHARNRNDQKQAGITVRKKLIHGKKKFAQLISDELASFNAFFYRHISDEAGVRRLRQLFYFDVARWANLRCLAETDSMAAIMPDNLWLLRQT